MTYSDRFYFDLLIVTKIKYAWSSSTSYSKMVTLQWYQYFVQSHLVFFLFFFSRFVLFSLPMLVLFCPFLSLFTLLFSFPLLLGLSSASHLNLIHLLPLYFFLVISFKTFSGLLVFFSLFSLKQICFIIFFIFTRNQRGKSGEIFWTWTHLDEKQACTTLYWKITEWNEKMEIFFLYFLIITERPFWTWFTWGYQ